jgi:alpha-D-xyloside xylohydrolase
MPEARKIISDHFSKHILSKGISGFKMDENDGYDEWLWPDVARFPSGNTAEQMRQTYAMMMQKDDGGFIPSTKYQDLWFG